MENLATMFNERCRVDADKTAYLVKEDNRWNPVTWSEAADRVEKIAAGLLSLGLEPGDTVCILGNTRIEWTTADMAAIRSGCVSVGIYPTLSGEQAAYILKDSNAKILFIENNDQLQKITPQLENLTDLKWIISWEEVEERPNVLGIDELKAKGVEALKSDPKLVEKAEETLDYEDVAIIIYTSGTTGPPKGAMLTHKNILVQLETVNVLRDEDLGDTMMFFLPLAHVGERVAGHYNRIYRGITGAFVKDINKILDDMASIKPTFFGSVPRIFEKAYARIQSEVEAAPPLKKALFKWAEGVGRQASRIKQGGKEPEGLFKLKYAIADKLVLSKIREIFGGKVRYFLSGAAPISLEILEFFHACGMLILEAYGQTEMTAFCTMNTADDYRLGSVGKTLPNMELKFADDGEIMVRGDVVFPGYRNQPELNAETLTEDGWIYSGDIGRMDEDGFVWITGRKKEIIITSGGKNITPSNIENELKNHPLIEQALVHGDRRKYLTALIGLAPDMVEVWAKDKGKADLSYAEIVQLDEMKNEVQGLVEEANKNLARYETIKYFYLLPALLEIETGDLTPTMKIRRNIVEEKFKNELNSLYDEKM